MVMAALEDKTYRGAGIASPSMAWVWGQLAGYSGPYHLVWSRDLYQVATAQLAAGDRAAAGPRARPPVRRASRSPTAACRRTATSTARPHWGGLQLDEVADPILLAWQLGRTDAATWGHVRLAAECILARRADHAGALGERGRLLAGVDRRARSPGSWPRRRSPRATGRTPTRSATARSPTTWRSRARRVDRDDERPALGRSVLPPAERRRERGRGHDVRARRRRPDHRPARGRRPELPRARAARRAAGGRPGGALDAPGRRPRAGGRHAERPLLAPLLARRLRRDGDRRPVRGRRVREPRHRPGLADLRGRARRVRAGRRRAVGRPAGGARRRARPARRDGRDAPARA